MVIFTGIQSVTLALGQNNISLTLVQISGNIEIDISGDVTAPEIISGPSVSVDSDVTITWATNENSTSNICYSLTSGFNYNTQVTWPPVGQDITADSTVHIVTVTGIPYGTYYYMEQVYPEGNQYNRIEFD